MMMADAMQEASFIITTRKPNSLDLLRSYCLISNSESWESSRFEDFDTANWARDTRKSISSFTQNTGESDENYSET